MKWKYMGWALLAVLVVLLLIPVYQYVSSVDWSRQHSQRVAALPAYEGTEDAGSFRLVVGEFEFLVRVAGMNNDGPGVVLLHGFPESSIMWDALLPRVASAGYRVVAFDQRGYSPGARPGDRDAYHISNLTQDVLDVADVAGFDTFHLVGHDWGAAVGWNVAMLHPERLLSLTSMAIPHIGVFFEAIVNDPEQKARSSYMNRLRRPFLPEYAFISNNQQFFRQLMQGLPDAHLNEYVALQAEHGAATATLNWYRAVDFAEAMDNTYKQPVTTPTLFIWGKEDGVIAPSIIPRQEAFIDGPYKEVALQTGHALIQSKPDSVIAEILMQFERNG